MKAPLRLLLLALVAWMAALPAPAHGLLARVRVDGNVIVGTVYYSSGEPAGGEWVQIFNSSQGNAPVSEFSAAPDGTFRFEGAPGNDYLITVQGDEGHSIELSMSIAQGARARLVDEPTESEAAGLADLPAWAVIGAMLALLSAVALFHRARRRGPLRGAA